MWTRQVSAQETPRTSGANDDQEDFVITIKRIIKEEFDKHEKKIDEMIKLHLQSTNERLDKVFMDVTRLRRTWSLLRVRSMKN